MYDFHMHSTFSADCEVPMEEMVQAGIKQQLKKICFTEHIDYEYPDPSITFDVDLDQYENEIKKMNERFGSQIQVLKGIELGVQPHILEQYRQLLRERSFDFIICSMHSTDGKDLHSGKLFEGLKLDEAYEKYYGELYDCVKNFEGFNILGHLDLVTRYKYEEGVYHFLDIIEEIFKTIMPRGQGIEINTSGYKYNMGRLLPSKDILQLYYDMGGEIITIGSDAHKPERIGDRIDEATELLKDIGFKYISTFEKGTPDFHKID
ncbi:histidinol-phosphatase HisJ family protein [Allobacillus sp. SKP2-8]|uniref:histidinol-phosphatase HisJ family protein n=1 Tax=unclassified Allobacillus TaxID=2628859 RepID=UPI0011837AF8|nr:histidinol-phosphatase HisJ family protein [Allobacillus sp. SKP2-8]TSJ68245.1 histidinol-phosphatase HisJ family protein [Allobacillus sp. SKP2-8]